MSPSRDELIEIVNLSKQSSRILSICYVLRYSPFFTKIKELLEQKVIGDLVIIMGTKGQIRGNMEENTLEVMDFVTGNQSKILLHTPKGGHSGSDVAMMKDFVSVVASDGNFKSKSNALEAIDSHLIALAAEESRMQKGKVIRL